jgi:predicted dehydrogenase
MASAPEPKNVRVGILGTGWVAGVHAKHLSGEPGVSIVAVCGRTASRAQELAQTHRAAAYGSVREMIARERLDACYVCLPPYAHDGQTEELARAGIHLFLEKPIAHDVARGERMAEAVAQAGVVTQVGFHMRHGTASRALKRALEEGEAGRPTLFHGLWWCNNVHSAWWRDDERSGGQLIEQAIHIYDLALWYLGKAVEVNAAWGNLCHGQVPDYTVDDTSAALIRFASGAIATVSASNCAIPWQWTPRWSLVCERLTAELSGINDGAFTRTADPGAVTRWTEQREADPYLAETREFIAGVRGGPRPGAPIGDGLAALRLVHAARRSAIERRPISLV